MPARSFYAYILASRRNGTLYVGVTRNLAERVEHHRQGVVPGLTRDRAATRLVWYETHDTPYLAITREKRIKHWKRAWKIDLIERANPSWTDLCDSLV